MNNLNEYNKNYILITDLIFGASTVLSWEFIYINSNLCFCIYLFNWKLYLNSQAWPE